MFFYEVNDKNLKKKILEYIATADNCDVLRDMLSVFDGSFLVLPESLVGQDIPMSDVFYKEDKIIFKTQNYLHKPPAGVSLLKGDDLWLIT